jgi:hypothetical protein
MYVGRTVAAVNPYSRAPAGRVSKAGNPAWLLTLGPMNPKAKKGSNLVAKKSKKASGHHAVAHKKITMSQNRFLTLMGKKKGKKGKKHRSSSNPFATSITLGKPVKVATAGAGVLVGVALVKGIGNSSFVPATISGNNLFLTLFKFGLAGVVWWGLSMIDPEFGAAAGLGGIAEAGSNALNTWFPSIGQYSPLGDFVPGRFAVPQNPVLDGNMSLPSSPSRRSAAYGGAYRVAAA